MNMNEYEQITKNMTDEEKDQWLKEQLQIDIYSCKDFKVEDVLKFLKKKEVYDIKYKLINREKDLKNA